MIFRNLKTKFLRLILFLGLIVSVLIAKNVSSFSWQDPTITPEQTLIRKVHLDEIRNNINSIRTDIGLAPYAWTDPSIVAGQTPIKAQHIVDAIKAIDEISDKLGDYYTPSWSPVFSASVLEPVLGKKYVYNFVLDGPGGWLSPRCVCDTNNSTVDCGNNWVTDDPIGTICYDQYIFCFDVFCSNSSNKYVVQEAVVDYIALDYRLDSSTTRTVHIEKLREEIDAAYDAVNSITCCGSYGGINTGSRGSCPGIYDSACGTTCRACAGIDDCNGSAQTTGWEDNLYGCNGSKRCYQGVCRSCNGFLYSDGCGGCASQGGKGCWFDHVNQAGAWEWYHCAYACGAFGRGGCQGGDWNDNTNCTVCRHFWEWWYGWGPSCYAYYWGAAPGMIMDNDAVPYYGEADFCVYRGYSHGRNAVAQGCAASFGPYYGAYKGFRQCICRW